MNDAPPSPSQVTLITQEFFPKIGGAATVVGEIAGAAAGLGLKVTVLAPGSNQAEDSAHNFSVERTGTRGKQDWLDRLALIRILRKRKQVADEEWVFAEPGAVRAALYSPLFGIHFRRPPVLILHGTEILRFTQWPHRRILFRRLIDQCRCVHVLSHHNRDLLQKRLPNIQTPIIVAPGAPSIDPDAVFDSGNPKESIEAPLVTILTVGRIHPRKGQLKTLEALSRLPIGDQKKIRYRVVGPSVHSRYREKILTLASTCCFQTELTGALDDSELASEYRSADIFALTSQQEKLSVEGFGLVYLDASMRGLPIVATRTGGIPEAVIDGETGLLADESSTAEISECFERLIRDPELRKKLGKAGRAFASKHSWEATVRAIFPGLEGRKKK